MSLTGRYYDGQTAQSVELWLEIDDTGVISATPAVFEPVSIRDLKVDSRVGNTPRTLRFASGASFETDDNETVDAWLKEHIQHRGWAHRLESKLSYVLGSLFLMAAFVVAGALWGVPWISNIVAHALPTEVNIKLGEGAMDSMDRFFFKPSKLDQKRRDELTGLFNRLLPEDREGFDYQLLFRHGGYIGPNAFALPNGNVVMTDELVELAANTDEIASVLLHEIGHVVHRHSLRQVLNHSGLAVITLVVLGDVNSAGAIIVGLPSMLFQTSYSRELEWEADGYSLEKMQALGINPIHFADFMERLENYEPLFPEEEEDIAMEDDAEQVAQAPTSDVTQVTETDGETVAEEQPSASCSPGVDYDDEEDVPAWFDYLSTHPATADRIARFRDFATSGDNAGL